MIESLTLVAPKNCISRDNFPKSKVDHFERMTGILKTRRTEKTATELAIEAAKKHVHSFGNVYFEAIIVVTQSQDRSSPCMAIDVHRELELNRTIPCFDINQSCDGLIYGTWIASKIDGPVLLICVDKLRAPEDLLDSLIFSDGACAMTIKGSEGFTLPWFISDGSGAPKLCSDINGLLKMDGGAVYDFVTTNIPGLIKGYDATFGPFDYLVQHQPNLSMMKVVEKRSGFEEKTLHCIEEFGNMSMVSIASALALYPELIKNKKILLCGYGAGWSAACMGVYWPNKEITTIWEVE